MAPLDIARERLRNQGLAGAPFAMPEDVVAWLGAVQAQDYAGAKWSLGVRMRAATDGDLDRAFAEGVILRTHVLRPTWHFVTPADIRWLLALTAPRVHALNATMYRRLELDGAVIRRSHEALARALEGGQYLTRDELRGVLEQAGIVADDGLRLAYLMMAAELDGVICSGPRRGKRFTYALLDERAPRGGMLADLEALAELARRFFLSRGPATVHDFANWSGLTVADARRGLEEIKSRLHTEDVGGQALWFPEPSLPATGVPRRAYLLSVYDEYFIGYKDRGAIVSAGLAASLGAMGNALQYIVVLDGQVVGTWKRTLGKDAVHVEIGVLVPLTADGQRAVAAAAEEYAGFVGLPLVMAGAGSESGG